LRVGTSSAKASARAAAIMGRNVRIDRTIMLPWMAWTFNYGPASKDDMDASPFSLSLLQT
jgi:hypothetical protein